MNMETTTKQETPSIEQLEFLDELRESGVTNMFGARPYLVDHFDISKSEAGTILNFWMSSFPRD